MIIVEISSTESNEVIKSKTHGNRPNLPQKWILPQYLDSPCCRTTELQQGSAESKRRRFAGNRSSRGSISRLISMCGSNHQNSTTKRNPKISLERGLLAQSSQRLYRNPSQLRKSRHGTLPSHRCWQKLNIEPTRP